MRIIKLAIISGVVLFLIVFLMSLLIPSHVRVSRAVNITVSRDSLLARLTDLRQWKEWNELVKNTGSAMVQFTADSISSADITVSKQAVAGDTLFTAWRQHHKRQLQSAFAWQGNSDVLVVQWYFDFKLRWYPWEKISSIVFDKQLGPPMEKSLDNLKKLLEKRP
jgi:hypothetical protein